MTDQITFEAAEFASNPAARCPCLLLLDVSSSMNGKPIAELNTGLVTFRDALASDALAMDRVEVGIVTFGPVRIELPFQNAALFYPPTLSAQGDTPMGAAIYQGIEMLRQRKDTIRANGVSVYRPWIFLITDGSPTDDWQAAAAAVREGEASRAFSFFAVGVKGANMEVLRQISEREPLMLDGLKFREFFLWLTGTLQSVTRTIPGTQFLLPPPKGWTSV